MTDQNSGRHWVPHPFLTHLNQRHPDTVLFLAHHLTGDSEISAAELVDVEARQLTLRLKTAGGWDTVEVSLDTSVRYRAELLDELSRLLRTARSAAPAEPLTSLETDLASHPHPGRH